MARKISVIKQQILDQMAANTYLAPLTSPSMVSIWGNFVYIIAVCQNLFEQLQDIFVAEIEGYVQGAGVGTPTWLTIQILKFQYSATTAQYVQLNTSSFEISYPIVDTTLQILTRCSVQSNGAGPLNVLVAKQNPPVALSSGEITSLESYVKELQFSGKEINIVSLNADSLIVVGQVYYDGQYSSVISDNVVNALIAYCSNLSSVTNFGTAVYLKDIEDAMLKVQGVIDIDLSEVSVRPDGVSIGSRYEIYNLSTGVNNRLFTPVSGYIVQETTSGYDFASTLTFIAN